jgi:hypothetical protein
MNVIPGTSKHGQTLAKWDEHCVRCRPGREIVGFWAGPRRRHDNRKRERGGPLPL